MTSRAREEPATVLSVQVGNALASYKPPPPGAVGPSLKSHIADQLVKWLASRPSTETVWHDGPGLAASYFAAESEGPGPMSPFPCGLPEGRVPIKRVTHDTINPARIYFKASNNHRVYIRIGRYISSLPRKCMVTVREDCAMPAIFNPFVELYAPTSPIPSQWLSCGLTNQDCCYFFDGLSLIPPGDWWLDQEMYYEKWEISGGYYYYFGFLDAGLSSLCDPPRAFSVEAVAAYYYRDEREHKNKDAKPSLA
jgi:hypothetical protein